MKLKLKFVGSRKTPYGKALIWEALTHGYMGVIPVTPGSQIVLSEHTFWRGQFDKGV